MKYVVVFLTGAAGYSFLEIFWRGYTHWTMSISGGLCFVMLYFMNLSITSFNVLEKCLLGSALITFVEFVVGIAVNVILKWNVWDYSEIPFNFMGQICLPYSVLWFFLCFPVLKICTAMNAFLTSH